MTRTADEIIESAMEYYRDKGELPPDFSQEMKASIVEKANRLGLTRKMVLDFSIYGATALLDTALHFGKSRQKQLDESAQDNGFLRPEELLRSGP